MSGGGASRGFTATLRSRYVPYRIAGLKEAEAMTTDVRILGIDPGLRRTGWGLITARGTKLSYLACGVVTSTATCRWRCACASCTRA